MGFASDDLNAIYQNLDSDPDTGLTAEQAEAAFQLHGPNRFEEEVRETVLQKAFHHLTDFTSLILLAAMAIAFYLALTSDHSFTDAIVILAIVVLNISLAVRQEMGAEKALEALRRMNAQITVVIRNSQPQPIDAIMLVPGDIVSLQAGDLIPADARIIESIDLKVEESALTGESVAVEKDANAIIDSQASIGDRLNMLFSGCLVTNGRARAIVVATGMQTEMGKIALLLNTTKRSKTPLQKKMDVFGRIICFVGLGAGALLFLLQVFSEPLPVVLLNAVSLAVAVIPECLPIIVTITLAYGVSNMAKKQAIIRRIPAVETLGSASVICTDKTGTLTQNRMTVQQVWSVNHQPKATDVELNHDERILVEMMGLASNASLGSRTSETLDTGDRDLNKNSNSEYVDKTVGDPTETAILLLLRDIGIEKPSLDAIYPRVFEIPFDSERKLMTTVHELDDHRYISITKGAFDRIPVEASAKSAQAAQVVHDQFAEGALRVLAVAYKYYEDLPVNLGPDELEAGLTFAGLVGMIDPPRPETLDAVETARQAGIKTVMITGDHALTASAIASQTGILATGGRVVTGAEMAKMSDDDLALHVLDYSVYARVSPEDKIRIVKAWQSKGEVVAMTGDGVNDAPALKAADVGVAMGSGTDVSKNASDVVLTDDNYASIVNAVAEGRRVYDNIRKVISSLVACNMSEILIILFAVILGWGTPLVAIQLLFINVVADGIPDLCMCREPMEADVMRRRPISQSASIFTGGLGIRISIVAVVFTIISLAGFYLGSFVQISDSVAPSHAIGQTMAYVVIGWSSVVNIINVRSYDKSILTIGLLSNRLLFYGICLSLVLVAVTAGVPVVRDVFYCVPLSLTHWLVITGLSITPLFVVELIKLMQRGKKSISY